MVIVTFQPASKSFSVDLVQQLSYTVDSIFEIVEPLSHSRACQLLLLRIVNQLVSSEQLDLQLPHGQLVVVFLPRDEIEDGRGNHPIEQNIEERREKSTAHQLSHGHN
ncbi:hypothetical protein ACFX11_043585 [Malus domestica]